MAPVYLTEGAIAILSRGEADKTELKPVLQVTDIRLFKTQHNNNERYRILLSDGVFTQQGMLATQLNYLVHSEKLQKGSIVQLRQFVCNVIQKRMIIIIIDLDVIVQNFDPIGEPKPHSTKIETSLCGQSSTPDMSTRGRFVALMNKEQSNPWNTPVTGPGQNTPPRAEGTEATAVRSDAMAEPMINPMKELETLRNELHLLQARERQLHSANNALTEEILYEKVMRLSVEIKAKRLEETIRKAEEQLAMLTGRCAEARTIGYDEGIARFPITRQGQAFMKRFWEEEKAKFLKSGEFLHHLQEGAFVYFNYGYDSAMNGLSKNDAVSKLPEQPGFGPRRPT